MAKTPKTTKVDFSSFTKAELLKTIKTLDKRQTQLLNQIAKLQAEVAALRGSHICTCPECVNKAAVSLNDLANEAAANETLIPPATLEQRAADMNKLAAEVVADMPAALPNPYEDMTQPVAPAFKLPWENEQ